MANDVAKVCQVCGTALRGALGRHLHFFGLRRSSHNPNVCNRCDAHLQEGTTVELTVLFADLTGFTELTNQVGAERSYEIVNAFFHMATDVLVSHDAYIDKYIGDAVMAFFNVPIQRLDHAERAIAAALAIQQGIHAVSSAVGVTLQVRIGVASGSARLGRLGSSSSENFSVIGDVVNLASRLEAAAKPGQVMIDAAAFRSVRLLFGNPDAEQLELRGFNATVSAFRLDEHAAAVIGRFGTRRQKRHEQLGLGAVLFTILGAPCSLTIAAGPVLLLLGVGASAGAASTFIAALDVAQIRIPLQALGVAAALVNLYVVYRGAQRRRYARLVLQSAAERRKIHWVVGLAVFALLAVALETWHHVAVKGLSYFEPLM